LTNNRDGCEGSNLFGFIERKRRNWRERMIKNDSRNDNQVIRTREFLIEGKQSLSRNGAMPGSWTISHLKNDISE
jgi:hypothetical protein